MSQKTSHFYIWVSLVTVGVVACLLSLIKISDFKRLEDISLIESTLIKVKTIFESKSQTQGWQIYQNKDNTFIFQYPHKLALTEKSNQVELSHQIPFKNSGECDMMGEGKIYDNLTDFRMNFRIFNGTVKEAVQKNSPYMPVENYSGNALKISPGFIDEYKVGNLSGFSIYEGAEGCGHVIYYFPIKNNQTLVVEKAMIQALSPVIVREERDKALKVPGVTTPEESDQIFRQVLETFKFIYTS